MLLTESMPMKQAVNLAHALCQAVADEAGVRALFLKGPTAAMQGLRSSSHVSGDVDALCVPADRDAMEAGLRARGWRLRPVSTAAREFTTHSVTFIHDSWPCDIDLHTTFPGMLADPVTTFDALWERREEHLLAGVPVMTPDRVAQFLILVLHGLRSPGLVRNAQEIERARSMYRSELTDCERAALRELVARTESAEPTQDFFRSVGDPVEVPSRPSPSYALWQLKTGPSRTESWMVYAIESHGWQRARILFRALLPTRADMYADHPESAEGVWRLARAHIRRLSRAARLTPRAAGQVARARRALTAPQPEPADAGSAPAVTAPQSQHSPRRPVPPARTPLIAPHASEWTDDREILFVLPLQSSTSGVLALRDTAAALWTLIQEAGTSPDGLASAACAYWEIPAEAVRDDVALFLAQLVDYGALLAA